MLPIVSVATNIFSSGTAGTWSHLASTVLPDYIVTTLWLCLGVGSLAALIGVGTAWLVTHFDFPLRRSFEWALVLPLAMPAYVMAYAYTDVLQFAGPLQGCHAQPGIGLGTGLATPHKSGAGRQQAGDAALVQRLRLRVW